MSARIVVAGVLAVLLSAGPVVAQPAMTPGGPPQASEPAPPVATRTTRYGTTIAMVDGLSVGAVVLGVLTLIATASDYDEEEETPAISAVLFYGGATGLAIGGPLIHLSHRNRTGAGASLALRLGLPVAGALIGSAIAEDCDAPCDGDDSVAQLFVVGAVAAMVIDWTLLAKKEVRVAAPVQPYAAPVQGGGMTFGVGGSF